MDFPCQAQTDDNGQHKNTFVTMQNLCKCNKHEYQGLSFAKIISKTWICDKINDMWGIQQYALSARQCIATS